MIPEGEIERYSGCGSHRRITKKPGLKHSIDFDWTKKHHKKMWKMMSEILESNSAKKIKKKYPHVRDLEYHCLKKMGFEKGNMPYAYSFLCEYTLTHSEKWPTWAGWCPGMAATPPFGLCEGYKLNCLCGLYNEFRNTFNKCRYKDSYKDAAKIALKIAKLKLNPVNSGSKAYPKLYDWL